MSAMRFHVLMLLASLAPFAAGQNSREITALEKQFEVARAELAKSEERLVVTYERLEAHFKAMSEPGARRAFCDSIAAAIRELAPQHQEKLTKGKTGKAVPAAQQTLAAQEWLVLASAKTGLDPAFHAPVAAALVEPLRPLLADPASLAAPQLEDAVGAQASVLFDASRDFGWLWNERLYKRVPDAVEYAAQYSAYKEIGVRLDKARSPEKFDATGQRLPPGMVLVKGGSYEIGPDQGFPRKGLDRRATRVSVKAFFIDRTEVTNADYAKYLRSLAPEDMKAHLPSTFTIDDAGQIVPPTDKDDHPVAGVSFNDAMAYAASVGKRLPSEEEWEAAARGPKGFKYPWGDYESGRANDREIGRNDTMPVGSLPGGASHFGCLDLAGNVEEWVATKSDGDPIEAPLESSLVQAIIRGGNYNSKADGVAATFRWYSPGLTTRKATLGFRCAMSVPK